MNDGLLHQALAFHQQGQLDNALSAYRTLLKAPEPALPVFLNASAILRSQSLLSEALACLERGLALYPEEPGAWNNLGNCHLDSAAHQRAVVAYRRALALKPSFIDARISLAACLRELGHPHLAYATVLDGYRLPQPTQERQRLLIPLVEALLSLSIQEESSVDSRQLEALVQRIEAELRSQVAPTDPTRAGLLMAQLWIQVDQLDHALASRDQLIQDTNTFLATHPGLTLKKSFHKSWHGISWNLAIKLLKKGRLAEGWKLYEHGLQVSASGPQRWQRSLKKPFTPQQIPFWRGESLAGRRLLLLGEQGIGDSMMFATLLPRLQQEGARVFLLPGDRLVQIYRHSLPDVVVLSAEELRSGAYGPEHFDLQSPLGSVCQYRFPHLSDYAPRSPFLKANSEQTALLRGRYHDGRPLIGLSWQGGGKANRIAMKSIGLKQLAPVLERCDCRFVSLQYGDDAPHLERFRKATGIDVLHDDSIDPLGDMDGWLSQVAAMDGVLSIANTTIHGAGGLGIPTLCLVSEQADWRWIDPDIHQGCYWYPSVEVAYQADRGNWQPALDQASRWLDHRCALVSA